MQDQYYQDVYEYDEDVEDYYDQESYDFPTRSDISTDQWDSAISPLHILPPVAAVIVSILFVLLFSALRNHDVQAIDSPNPLEKTLQPDTPKTSSQISPVFTDEVLYWTPRILRWANEYDLDPNLVATVMQIESCGDPNALSHAGAMGLFQVMPFHFQEGDNPYKPNINAKRGMAYLSASLKDKNGDIRLALAGYNGGISGARQPENTWPSEMQRYAIWGMGIYKEASENATTSPTLERWLTSGGASLCRQAALSLESNP